MRERVGSKYSTHSANGRIRKNTTGERERWEQSAVGAMRGRLPRGAVEPESRSERYARRKINLYGPFTEDVCLRE